MKVSDLRGQLQAEETTLTKSALADVEVEGKTLSFNGTSLEIADDFSMGTLAKFLGVPKDWFLGISDERLVQEILNYSLDRMSDGVALFEHTESELRSIYHVADRIIPRERFLDVIESVLPPSTEVQNWNFSQASLRVDATVKKLKAEPRVGDVTLGGLRFVGFVAPRQQSPYVSSYLLRLACTNGMTREEEDSLIRVRGNTVDEVIAEMEDAAQRILGESVPQRLEQFAHLSEHEVANPDRFVIRIAQEYGLGLKVQREILTRVAGLEENTMYDLVNLITSMQHESGVTQRQISLLQEIGGQIIATYAENRCRACQQLL